FFSEAMRGANPAYGSRELWPLSAILLFYPRTVLQYAPLELVLPRPCGFSLSAAWLLGRGSSSLSIGVVRRGPFFLSPGIWNTRSLHFGTLSGGGPPFRGLVGFAGTRQSQRC